MALVRGAIYIFVARRGGVVIAGCFAGNAWGRNVPPSHKFDFDVSLTRCGVIVVTLHVCWWVWYCRCRCAGNDGKHYQQQE
jgi:hypothetical protein